MILDFVRLGIRLSKRIYAYGLHNLLFVRAIVIVGVLVSNFVYYVHTLRYHTESRLCSA